MRCPSCTEDDDKVLESRTVRGGAAIRRRRVCLRCGRRFTTYEEVLRDSLVVVKRDGRREEFSRAKLENGIVRSCLKRPVSIRKIASIVDGIIEEMESRYELEIPAPAIGDAAMRELLKLDEVAYVRYASIYRHFANLDQFVAEIRDLRSQDESAARDGGPAPAAAPAPPPETP